MAADFVRDHRLDGVQILTADARRTGPPSGSFDLVFSRTLLINIPQPAAVVAEMARLARPDGWVAAMEYDLEYALCYKPHPAFDRICEIFTAAFRWNGADPRIGRRVPEMFRQAGLADIGVEARAPVYPAGHQRRMIRPDLVRSMRTRVLELGLCGEAELDELDAAARAHLSDPRTLIMSGLLFLTWAREPRLPQSSARPVAFGLSPAPRPPARRREPTPTRRPLSRTAGRPGPGPRHGPRRSSGCIRATRPSSYPSMPTLRRCR
jgi:SAM-dependent methyltransferase